MDVGFFIFPSGPLLSHLIHVFVCVCVSGGEYSCVHLCVASWQNVGHGATAAAWRALTWKWPKSHSLQNLSLCIHPFFFSLCPCLSPWMFPSPFIFILCAFSYWLSKCLWIPLSHFPVFSISRLSAVFFYFFIQSSLLFSHISYSVFHFLPFDC